MLTTDSNILWNQCGFVVSCRGTVWHALSKQVLHTVIVLFFTLCFLCGAGAALRVHSLYISPRTRGGGRGGGWLPLKTKRRAERSSWSSCTDLLSRNRKRTLQIRVAAAPDTIRHHSAPSLHGVPASDCYICIHREKSTLERQSMLDGCFEGSSNMTFSGIAKKKKH